MCRGPGCGPLWNSPQLDLVNIGGTDYAPHLYASPLYVDNVTLSGDLYGGCSFQVVFAATGNAFVYAVNAFDNSVCGPLVPASRSSAGAFLTRCCMPSTRANPAITAADLGYPSGHWRQPEWCPER